MQSGNRDMLSIFQCFFNFLWLNGIGLNRGQICRWNGLSAGETSGTWESRFYEQKRRAEEIVGDGE